MKSTTYFVGAHWPNLAELIMSIGNFNLRRILVRERVRNGKNG